MALTKYAKPRRRSRRKASARRRNANGYKLDRHTLAHLTKWVEKYYDPEDVDWAVGVMRDDLEARDKDDAEYWIDKGWSALEDMLQHEKKLGWNIVQKRPGKRDDPAQTRMFNPKRRSRLRGKRAAQGGRRRRNPQLVAYLANPGLGAQIASDVQAILYRHARDGEYYLHVFGNQTDGEIMRKGAREYLRLDNLPQRTGVQLVGRGNVLIVRHRDGRRLEQEF